MRFKNLFVLSLVLVALCASNAHSIGDSIGKSVDRLLDESNGIYIHDINHPENPHEARMLWSKERRINFTMPSKLSGNGTSPEASKISTQAGEGIQFNTASTINVFQNPSSQGVTPSQAISVAGNWSFQLRDSKNRVLALTLFQSEGAIFGTGTINYGEDTLEVSASGSVEGNKLNLDVTSSGTIALYRLALLASDNSASGEYRAFQTSGEPWIGLAEGMRTTSD